MRKILGKLEIAVFLAAVPYLTWAQGFDCLQARPFKDAVSFEKTDCSNAYAMGESLLDEFKEQRMKTLKLNLGLSLNNTILKDIDSMAHVDFLHSYFNQDYGEGSACSLSQAYEEFPCLKEGNTNLNELTQGQYSSVKELFSALAKRYTDRVTGKIQNNPKQCLNHFLRKKIAMDSFLLENKDFDLKDFALKKERNEKPGEAQSEVYKQIRAFLFDSDDDIDLSGIEGDNLSQQLESLVRNNSKGFEKRALKSCQGMLKRIAGVVCSPVTQHRIEDPNLNNILFQYDQETHQSGFDELEAEFSEIGIDNVYGHFVLNCQPKCQENCDDKVTIDDIQEKFFTRGLYEDFVYANKEDQFYNEKLDKEFCPLIACSNALEVQKGAKCSPLEKARDIKDIKVYLNCKEDQYCNTSGFKSFAGLLKTQRSSSEDFVLTSFTQRFLGDSFSPQKVYSSVSVPVSAREAGRVSGEGEAKEVRPLTKKNPAPEIARRAQKIMKALPREATFGQEEGGEESNRTLAQMKPLISPRGDAQIPRENQYDRDLYKRMGKIIRGAMEHQEKSSDYYQRNLEDVVASNKALEEKIRSRLGEGVIAANEQEFLGAQRKAPYRERESSYRKREDEQNLAWQNALAENKRLKGRWNDLGASGDRREEGRDKGEQNSLISKKRLKSMQRGEDGKVAGEVVSNSGQGPSEKAPRLGALAGGALFKEGLKSVDTQINTLSQMDQKELISFGVDLEEPFLIRVKVEERYVTVPVRPFLYKGKKMLAPVINQENWILSNVLRKSPLFSSYYAYEKMREASLSSL